MIDICTDLELPSTGDLWQGFRCKRIYYGFVKGTFFLSFLDCLILLLYLLLFNLETFYAVVDVPPALLDVLLLLLETDPSKRPTAEEICCIPILAKCIHKRRVLFFLSHYLIIFMRILLCTVYLYVLTGAE